MKKNFPLLLILSLAIVIAYGFAIQGTFKTLDDEVSIIHNPWIKDLSHLDHIFSTSYFGTNDYYRPLVTLSYALEYHFFGLRASHYYWDNIFLHIATTIVLFFLLEKILEHRMLAFSIALLFGIHPLHWEEISNISGRSILLSGLGTILAFWFFLCKNRIAYLASLLSFTLALFSKESAIVLPLVLLWHQRCLKPDSLKRSIASIIPYFILVALFFALRHYLGVTQLFYERSFIEILLETLTFLKGLLIYVGLFFFPTELHYDRALTLIHGLFNIDVLFCIAIYGFILWLLFHFKKNISSLAWFFLGWFLLELLPVSQIFVFIGIQPGYISLAEHFLYTASIGFLGLSGLAYFYIISWNDRQRVFSATLLKLIIIGFYTFMLSTTVVTNFLNRTEDMMLKRTISQNPYNARMRYNLGVVDSRQKDFKSAQENFHIASALSPQVMIPAKIGEAKALCDQGKLWEGLTVYESISEAGKYKELLENNKKLTLQLLLNHYQSLLNTTPGDPKILYSMGIVYFKLGDNQKAMDFFLQTTEALPDERNALFNLASTYALAGQNPQAVATYQKVINLGQPTDALSLQAQALLNKLLNR